jgi:cell division protein FtsQ
VSRETFKYSVFGALFLSLIVAFHQLNLSHYFPIQTVRVYGIHHLKETDVESALTPLVRQGFFALHITPIRQKLLEMPWVANIIVQKHWPNRVDIRILEKNAVATWSDPEHLLSDAGEIFLPQEKLTPNTLPFLKGPPGSQVVMLQYLREMNRLLQPLHAKISSIELSSFLTWKLTLDNGITLQLGHKDILTRLSHFVRVYPKIVGNHAADVENIDLRYPNGVAVAWRTVNTSSS